MTSTRSPSTGISEPVLLAAVTVTFTERPALSVVASINGRAGCDGAVVANDAVSWRSAMTAAFAATIFPSGPRKEATTKDFMLRLVASQRRATRAAAVPSNTHG